MLDGTYGIVHIRNFFGFMLYGSTWASACTTMNMSLTITITRQCIIIQTNLHIFILYVAKNLR